MVFQNLAHVFQTPELLEIVTTIWKPPVDFKFPKSGKRNLKFQASWLVQFKWLAYSAKEDGAFCISCVAYGVTVAGKGDMKLGRLVCKPFCNWKDAIEQFKYHASLDYHKKAVIGIENLKDIQRGKIQPIDVQVDSHRETVNRENREKLRPIVGAIILCGRQGIALRGHRDDGSIFSEEKETEGENEIASNEGNFRAILRYRAQGDNILRNHLTHFDKNATYVSKTIQNEIIDICHQLIKKKIVSKVNQSKAFAVLADETTDIAGMEQLSICVRYLDISGSNLCEDFIGFVKVDDVTGKGLAETIRDYLLQAGVDCSYMYGQGYDGAPAMSGELHGAQSYIQRYFPLAIYVHCAAHSFNLAVNAACDVTGIKNALGTIGLIQNFFHWPKRLNILKKAISELENESRKEKLKSVCPTRWAERHEAVSTYLELQPAVINALEELKSCNDNNTSTTASQILAAIYTIDFQMSCNIMQSVHSIVLPLSRILQAKNQDLVEAIELTDNALNEFKVMRQEAGSHFHDIFERVKNICAQYEVEIKIPRLASRQKNRCNINVNNAEDYFRIAFYIPFIDAYVTHLHSRFAKHRSIFEGFGILFPKHEFDNEKCRKLHKFYSQTLNATEEEFIAEVKMWRHRFKNNVIQNALDALKVRKGYEMLRAVNCRPILN